MKYAILPLAILAACPALAWGIDLIPPAETQTVVEAASTRTEPAKPAAAKIEADKKSDVTAGSGIAPLEPSGAKGYWFYRTHPKAAPKFEPPMKRPPEKPVPKRCQSETTWTAQCGFVLPSSFSMQSKERDALLRNMVMAPSNPDAVAAVQDYIHWILHQAFYAANVWRYNALKNPQKYDTRSTSPVSAIGLRLASDIKSDNEKEVWRTIRKMGGFIIVFTKASCDYCHRQAQPLWWLQKDTGLDVWDASIGGVCLKRYAKTRCVSPAKSTLPARILKVSTVPTTVLYIPKGVWIRIGAGLTTTDVLEARLYNLFVSWKMAANNAAMQTARTGLDLNPSDYPKDSQALKKILDMPIKKGGTKHAGS